MTWRDALRLAAQSVRRRVGRVALTILAITLATPLLVALGTIVVTANTRVLRQVSKGGPITAIRVQAARARSGQLSTDDFRPGKPVKIDDGTVARIRSMPGVAAVAPVLDLPTLAVPDVPSGGRQIQDRVVGVDIHQVANLPVTLIAGRLPAPGSWNEVAVTLAYLDRLGIPADEPRRVLGTSVALGSPQGYYGYAQPGPEYRGRWVDATITGIVAQDAAPGSFLVPIELALADREWALQGQDSPDQPRPTSPYSALVVVAETLDDVHELRASITDLGYSNSAPEQLIANIDRYLRVVDIVLGAIGLIALGIASLGVTNALLAAVRERRREIGVSKAIGARDRDVRRVFLLEAGIVGAAGGAIGTAVGLTLAAAVGAVVNAYLRRQGLVGIDLLVPPWLVVAGIVGSALLAVVAGTLPAMRAAHLPAREAVAEP